MSHAALRPLAFAEYVAERRADVDAALERWLPASPDCPAVLAEAMRYAVASGGKRFRPVLTLAAADAVAVANGGDDEARAAALALALPVACAVELVHTQSLVHDDLPAMDDDVLRRGQPTVHVRYGEGLAILVGDGLLAEAFGLLARYPSGREVPHAEPRKLQVIAELGRAVGAAGMVGGQAIDLAVTGSCGPGGKGADLDLAALSDMHARKTGGLIRAAAVGGAVMAGASADQVAAMAAFAERVGLAFQIVDDVLDVEGCAATLGKTAGKDAGAGKVTFPGLVGRDQARVMAIEAVADAEAVLASAGLSTPYLTGLARSVVHRRD
jgi:geranylgeranyl pyrophosphate synthase